MENDKKQLNFLNEFVKKVLSCDTSFTIITKEDKCTRYNRFIQEQVGNGKYIYMYYDYLETGLSCIVKSFNMVAVVANGNVYIFNRYALGVRDGSLLNECSCGQVYTFAEAHKVEQERAKAITMQYYAAITPYEFTEPGGIRDLEREARNRLFSEKSVFKDVITPSLSEQDVTDNLTGVRSTNDIVLEKLESEKDTLLCYKSEEKKIEELMMTPDIAEDYEREIIFGLNSVVHAKSVLVEFELDGRTAEAKMDPNCIRKHLIDDENFSSYCFDTYKSGEVLFAQLNATDNICGNSKRFLTCRNIRKIAYGKKTLYEKK